MTLRTALCKDLDEDLLDSWCLRQGIYAKQVKKAETVDVLLALLFPGLIGLFLVGLVVVAVAFFFLDVHSWLLLLALSPLLPWVAVLFWERPDLHLRFLADVRKLRESLGFGDQKLYEALVKAWAVASLRNLGLAICYDEKAMKQDGVPRERIRELESQKATNKAIFDRIYNVASRFVAVGDRSHYFKDPDERGAFLRSKHPKQ